MGGTRSSGTAGVGAGGAPAAGGSPDLSPVGIRSVLERNPDLMSLVDMTTIPSGTGKPSVVVYAKDRSIKTKDFLYLIEAELNKMGSTFVGWGGGDTMRDFIRRIGRTNVPLAFSNNVFLTADLGAGRSVSITAR